MATQHIVTAKPEVHHLPRKPIGDSPTLMDLMQIALSNGAGMDVIERLTALQRDERNYQAQVAFDEALNRCQAKLTRISADAANTITNSRYATYAKLDSVVRPIYTAEGFSLSFGERDCPTPGKTRFVAFLCRAGVTREYLKDISPSTKGPKGNDVMTPIHADASADSYAKRYLLKDIFNLAIGEDDVDGNPQSTQAAVNNPNALKPELIEEMVGELSRAADAEHLQKIFRYAYSAASKANDTNAQAAYIAAKDRRRKEFRNGNASQHS